MKWAKEIVEGKDVVGHAAAVNLITLMDSVTREQWRLNRVIADELPSLPSSV